MSSKTPPLPTPTMIAMTLPTKKILLQTHQTATKTEDSLVFSWKGRDIYHFSFCIYFGHFLLDVFFFIFTIDFLSFAFILVVYLYVHEFYIPSSPPFHVHTLMPSGKFPLFAKTLPWRDIFASRDTFANAMKPEVFWL